MALDATQIAQARAERIARNMIYPGTHLSQSYYEDKDLGKIYVAIGKGDFSETVRNVWRGIWFVMMGAQGFGQQINCISGSLSEEDAINDALNQAKDPSHRLKKSGSYEEGYWSA